MVSSMLKMTKNMYSTSYPSIYLSINSFIYLSDKNVDENIKNVRNQIIKYGKISVLYGAGINLWNTGNNSSEPRNSNVRNSKLKM